MRCSGTELDRLAGTFNEVAERLQTTEQTRRRLLADLAHEMRTPLAVIEAYLDGLDDGMTDWTPQTARVLRDHTDRLVRLSDDVAEVSRAEEGRLDLQLERVEVGELLATATRGVEAGYRSKQVALVVTGRDGAGPLVEVGRQRLLQWRTNLLTNALRHTPSGGTVTVAAHHASSESGSDTRAI